MRSIPTTSLGNVCVATLGIRPTSRHSAILKCAFHQTAKAFQHVGGYDFPARPSLTGLEQTVFWTPEADSNALHIGPSPEIPFTDPRFSSDFHPSGQKSAIEGLHLSFDTGTGHIHLILLAGLQPNEPLSAHIPLDAFGLDRIEALTRLWRKLHGHKVPPDTRLTTQQRRRLKNMLRAVDGRMNNADYREIAEVIFGVERVAAEPWKTSALRDAVLDLVKDGFAMIDGGYRKLLRHRRRS
jgi:hypothetical protein